jgi:anti-sigma regulatory factor (Ser/Thr protein kinase)
MREYRAQYEAAAASIVAARRAVVAFAAECGFAAKELHDIELAAGEAISNAIEHGSRAHGPIGLGCVFVDATLAIEISDGGPGFANVVEPTPGAPPTFRGWGLFLMRSLMDRVTYSPSGGTVRLEKQLPRPEPGERGDASSLERT